MVKIIITLALSCIVITTISAQQSDWDTESFHLFDNGEYLYKNEIYDYKALSEIAKGYEPFDYWHNKMNKQNKSAYIMGFASIAVGGIGTLLVGNSCNDLGCLAVNVTAAGGALLGTFSIISLINASSSKAKSIRALQGKLKEKHLPESEISSFYIGMTQNGLGLVYVF